MPSRSRKGSPNGRKEYQKSLRVSQNQRKELRRKANEEAHKRNVKLRAAGVPTPWELACAARAERRAARRHDGEKADA